MRHRASLLAVLAGLVTLLIACTEPQKNTERDSADNDAEGLADRRAFVVMSKGEEAGTIIQKAERWAERGAGTYSVLDKQGNPHGYVDGLTGKVYDFRDPGGEKRQVGQVDVTTQDGLAAAAELVLNLPPPLQVLSARQARRGSGATAVKMAGKDDKKGEGEKK